MRDARDQTIGRFAELNDAQRCQLACDAWQIGLRAVTNAHRLADEARLGDIGKTLLEAIGQQLEQHTEQQEQRIHDGFARYLDPESGQLNERLRQLVGEGGTLPHLLERQIGPHNSVLVETLVKHVGEQSPLFKKLSPTDSQGLLALMSERLQTAMTESHAAPGFPTFQRIGQDILMTWDDENPVTDPYLEAALMAGLASRPFASWAPACVAA